MKDDDDTMCYRAELEAAVKAEREACAQLCEYMARRTQDIRRAALEMAAENIRYRGKDVMPLFDDWGKDWAK